MFVKDGDALIAKRTGSISRPKMLQIAKILGIQDPQQYQSAIVTFIQKPASAKKAKKTSKKR
jgi:hypothetical protein